MHADVVSKKQFDLLLNKENGAKIAWIKWDKYSGGTPKGAVSSAKGESQGEELYYIARWNFTNAHNHSHSLLGKFSYFCNVFKHKDFIIIFILLPQISRQTGATGRIRKEFLRREWSGIGKFKRNI